MLGDVLSSVCASVNKMDTVFTHIFTLEVEGRIFFLMHFSDTLNSTKTLNRIKKLWEG